MADGGTRGVLQKSIDTLPPDVQSRITLIWSLFSSSPSHHRTLILSGLLTICCPSQLSFLSSQLPLVTRIGDPFSLLPKELSLKILSFLDASSLGRAAQVNRKWRELADDDLLWKEMCKQHIERKCRKCGWGLPSMSSLGRERRGRSKDSLASSKSGSPERGRKIGGDERGRTVRIGEGAIVAADVEEVRVPNAGGDGGGEMEGVRPSKRLKTGSNEHGCSGSNSSRHSSRATTPLHESNPPPTSQAANPSVSPPSSSSSLGKRKTFSDSSSLPSVSSSTSSLLPVRPKLTRPWKSVYCERLAIERNWRSGNCSVRSLIGHADAITCLQVKEDLEHPKFPILMSGSWDRTVRIWNLASGECLGILRGHGRGIRCLKFDETKLITGSMDKTVKIWNWRDGKCLRTLEGHRDGVLSLDFDEEILVTGSCDGEVRVWNFSSGECFELRGHGDWVNEVKIWRVDGSDGVNRGRRGRAAGVGKKFGRMSVAEEGRGVSEGSELEDDDWSGEDDDELRYPEIFGNGGEKGRKGDDVGKLIISCSDDSTIRVWNLKTRECVRILRGHVAQVQAIEVLNFEVGGEEGNCEDDDGMELDVEEISNNTPSSNPTSRSSDLRPTTPPQNSQGSLPPLLSNFKTSLPYPEKSKLKIISAGLDNTLKTWDVENGHCERTMFGHIEGIWSVRGDRLRLSSGSQDSTVKIWDRDTGKCMHTLVGHQGAVTCTHLGDDKIVSGSDDSQIRVWSFSPVEN